MSDRHLQQVDPSWGDRASYASPYVRSKDRAKPSPVPMRKIPPETASLIRELYDNGKGTYRDLGKQFGCGFRCIGQIINREGAYKFDP